MNSSLETKGAEWRRGWPLVLAATLGMALISTPTYTMGVMMSPIEQDLGWSRVQISSGLTITSLLSITLGSIFGMAADRFGRRPFAIASSLLMCTALALFSTVQDNIVLWWIFWAVAGVAGTMASTVWASAVISRFTLSRGLALGITLSGSGIAAAIIPALGQSFIDDYGWRGAYFRLACIWAVIAVPLILAFFRDGSVKRRRGQPRVPAAAADQVGLTPREGFASAAFIKLAIGACLMTLASVAQGVNLVPIIRSQGIAQDSAAVIAGILGLASISGRIFGGFLVDRLKANFIAGGAAFMGCSLAITLLLFPGSVWAASAGVVVLGICSGAQFGAMVYLAGRHFGTRSFGVLYGAINSLIGMASGIGPVIANYVYDQTKSYDSVLLGVLPLFVCAAVIYLSLGRFPTFAKPGDPVGTVVAGASVRTATA